MKFFIITLCLIAAVVAEDFSEEQQKKWKSFKVKHGKMFMSKNKEAQRMKNFLVNCDHVEKTNERFANGEILHTACEYPHHDLSTEEFVARFCGAKEENGTDVRMAPIMRQTPLASIDLTLTAEVGAVRNQGQCGSCWTFSTTASTESRYYRTNKVAVDLSEQQLVECVYTRSGCNGGWMSTAFDWIKANGQTTEAQFPYTATYSAKCVTSKPKTFVAKSWVQVPGDVTSIKNALNQYGVLAIAVDASKWSSYQNGFFTAASMGSVNHAVNLVGYGKDSSGTEFWKIRNSWGTGWGEKGYIRVAMYPATGRSNTYAVASTFAVL
jgi:cathepsin K